MTYVRHGHGSDMARSPTYRAWESMLQRCYNPKHQRYCDYGAKGIIVCAAWHSFPSFLKDMGPKPSKALQLGRINSEGNYTPTNCRWMTRKQIGVFRQATHKGWAGVAQSR